ncbi:MAG: DoxX family protein [Devosia sp.]|uniref:DoxX family protein n=1 Tax=Devosia sp. TaxID=1871048 RepID=UPI0026162AFF|nr:DoxX family protein [Devosia sp.]MDB5587668.1 DoxX family protein [Devosia sp.]
MLTDTNLILLARLLLGGAFLIFGIRNIRNVDGLTAALTARGLPLPRVAAIIGVALQIGGGALTAVGPFGAIGGLALIVFVALATVLFHNFWDYSGPDRATHLNATIMNMGLAGASCSRSPALCNQSRRHSGASASSVTPIFKTEWRLGRFGGKPNMFGRIRVWSSTERT